MLTSSRRLALLALVPVLLWFLLLTLFHRDLVIDEYPHMNGIRHFAEGRWSLPPDLPMLPGYHVLMSLPSRLVGVHGTAVRFGSVLLAALLLAAHAATLRKLETPERSLLLLATLPVLFPFTALAYTEVAALAFLLAGLALQVRNKPALAWIALLAACLVRQSNVLWVAFFGLWEMMDRRDLRRVAGHAAILVAAVVFFVVRGRLSVGPVEEHAFLVNPAHLPSAGIWLGVLLAPLLVPEARRLRPAKSLSLLLLGALALALIYANPHPFNQDPLYLRNRVLLFLASGRVPAFLGSLVAMTAFALAWSRFRRDPQRKLLGALLAASMIFLLLHPPIDPRYLIVPMALLFTIPSYHPAETVRLAIWQAFLCLGICWGILTGSWML